jgi:hypothetical protein
MAERWYHAALAHVKAFGRGAFGALVLDDWKVLNDPKASGWQKAAAGADLASWVIPEGKVAKIAEHALVKAGEVVADRVAAKWAERSANAALANQHPMNPSRIWDRALTPAERGGAFENKHDLTAFLGPATEKRSAPRDWHHIVESHAEGRFGADRVQHVENVGAIPREPAHREITKRFATLDRSLGQSPREFLRDKPWEQHVAFGERELRARGLDPQALRAETAERFQERLELHDRLVPPRPELRVMRDGAAEALRPGERFVGSIARVAGDVVEQHVGRGETVAWSRAELEAHAADPKALDDALGSGALLKIGRDAAGEIRIERQAPDLGWQPLEPQAQPQPAVPERQQPAPTLDR